MTDNDYCNGVCPTGQICPLRDACARFRDYLHRKEVKADTGNAMAYNGHECPQFNPKGFIGG